MSPPRKTEESADAHKPDKNSTGDEPHQTGDLKSAPSSSQANESSGDRYELSGDFRGAVINIKSTIVSAAEAKEIENQPPEPGDPPYLGLQYFDENDASRFFGREQLTAQIANRLHNTHFLAIIGASGSGKSSVVRAGVIPTLQRGEPMADGSLPPTAGNRWDFRVFTPTVHPLEALGAALQRDAETVASIASLQQELAQESRTLGLAARRLLAQGGSQNLLLVVDQFEEAFTLCHNPDERRAFFDNLLAATDPDDSQPVTVILVLRADFYAQLAQHDHLRERVSQNQEFIGAMSRAELFDAIVKPAALGNWKIQEGLVDLMLDDVGDEPGALPLLSHALLETWKRRRGRTLTLSGYTESGGVRGAIAKTAESVFQQRLSPEQRPIARMIFIRLAELGDDSLDTRRRAAFSELITRSTDEPTINAVLKILTDARLVVTEVVPPTETKVVEVAHEALIREWPTLRQWLDQDRQGLILHRQLTDDVNEWIRLARDPGALYRGARLKQIQDWAINNDSQLSMQEQEFLDASRKNAEEEAARSLRLARAARVQRLLLALSGLLGLFLVAFLIYSSGLFAASARMDGIYNLAVAPIGWIDSKGVHQGKANPAGQTLGSTVYRILQEELTQNEPSILVGADGVKIKNRPLKIDPVPGDNASEKIAAASKIAGQINAQMLVFGNIDNRTNPPQLTLEFWITPTLGYQFEDIQGNYQVGQPIPLDDPQNPGLAIEPELRSQAGVFAWLAIGLNRAQLGQSQQALQAFNQAAKLDSNSAVVQFFIGQENLFLASQQPDPASFQQAAQKAFEASIQDDPDYYKSYVGAAGVYFQRAQGLRSAAQNADGSFDNSILAQAQQLADRAVISYTQALQLDKGNTAIDLQVENGARIGLGNSYRLKAEITEINQDLPQARQEIEQAIQTLETTLQPLSQAGQARLLTQAYEALGIAYQLNGYFSELSSDNAESKTYYQQSASYYDQCIAQANGSSDRVIKNEIVQKHCVPYRQEVQQRIDFLNGG
jgi:hypothetical protein